MRTLSVKPVFPDKPNGLQDLDGLVVDGIESLRQRVAQRLRFPLGTWHLDTRRGTPSVLGHGFPPALVASTINATIRDEGREEITEITDERVELDQETRVLTYVSTVQSIYGPMDVVTPVL